MPDLSLRSIYQPTVLLALALMAIIVMMILPMPSWVLDIGLAASFALAILMFTVTLFIERPLDFSAFPTILLASLMLRLSLNVSSTKLIIGEGHTGTAAAGNVIEGFANFVMSGSVFLGLVVFGVLLIVNFVVINKGATRMAEVGARFALDGMPGKQLAIDSDMSAGAIDHAEAKARRETEQAETTFFGSLDGASKFVKGDAIAGLLITMIAVPVTWWGALAGCVAITEPAFWAGFDRGSVEGFRDYFLQLTEWEPKRAAAHGIAHYSWICINPKEAEDPGFAREVTALIPEFLKKPNVLGVGEIGLNKNSRNEKQILADLNLKAARRASDASAFSAAPGRAEQSCYRCCSRH